ncbi:MAG: ABC-type multidrug transport system, ATPase and permease component, partial [Anaerocolumna sp.]|nr:ABC-type multidrug transport system, ATPase and permease component [Anaerocolumna sp.]
MNYYQKAKTLFTLREKIKFLILALLMFVGAFLEMVVIGCIVPFITIMSSQGTIRLPNFASAQINQLVAGNLLVVACVSLIIAFVIKNIYLVVVTRWQLNLIFDIQAVFSKRLFEFYLNKPYVFFLQKNISELQRNLNVEVGIFFGQVLLPVIT